MRVNLNLNDDDAADLNSLTGGKGFVSEEIRRAIRMRKRLRDLEKKGAKVIVVHPEGDREVIFL
jgi:hypothetical protein